MQIIPAYWDVGLWLSVTAIILLMTAEIVFSYNGQASLLIDKKKLKNAVLIICILFLITVAIRVYEILAAL